MKNLKKDPYVETETRMAATGGWGRGQGIMGDVGQRVQTYN